MTQAWYRSRRARAPGAAGPASQAEQPAAAADQRAQRHRVEEEQPQRRRDVREPGQLVGVRVAARRRGAACAWSSNAGRTPPSSRNHTTAYANAACTSGRSSQDTSRKAAPVRTTVSAPYALRIITSIASSSAVATHSSAVMCPAASSAARRRGPAAAERCSRPRR